MSVSTCRIRKPEPPRSLRRCRRHAIQPHRDAGDAVPSRLHRHADGDHPNTGVNFARRFTLLALDISRNLREGRGRGPDAEAIRADVSARLSTCQAVSDWLRTEHQHRIEAGGAPIRASLRGQSGRNSACPIGGPLQTGCPTSRTGWCGQLRSSCGSRAN